MQITKQILYNYINNPRRLIPHEINFILTLFKSARQWTVPQLSIRIIYSSIFLFNFIPLDKVYIVKWQSNLVNTKESLLPVCDKPYHKNNGIY